MAGIPARELSPSESRAASPFCKVIFDDRFDAGREFGREAEHLGASVVAIRSDITRVWYDDLYLRWQQGPAPIAGLTTARSLYTLDVLARDAGMRVIYRADHPSDASAGIGAASAQTVMSLATDLPRAIAPRVDLLVPSAQTQNLVSWVIAPVTRHVPAASPATLKENT